MHCFMVIDPEEVRAKKLGLMLLELDTHKSLSHVCHALSEKERERERERKRGRERQTDRETDKD